MYDVSPSQGEFERAFRVVSEVAQGTLKAYRISDADLRKLTDEVLKTCYSIGASYDEESVRAVARAKVADLQGRPDPSLE